MTADELALVSTDELWEELTRRHDGVVMVTMRNPTGGNEDKMIYYSRGFVLALGLLVYAQNQMLRQQPKVLPPE